MTTAAQWGDALLGLLPPSVRGLFSRAHETLSDLLDAIGAELARLDARTDAALDEMFPGAATETIGRWETMLGITPPAGATTAERQSAVAAKWRARGGCAPAYIKGVCEAFGYAVGDVDVIEPWPYGRPFRVEEGRVELDRIGRDDGKHAHTFLVTYPLPVNATMEAFVTEIKPAHTWAFFEAV